MSEDRLNKAIEAMKNETVDAETIESARVRVRQKLEGGPASVCDEFRSSFQDYMEEKLSENRRLLVEDHLSRCPKCRAFFAELKGERKITALPERRASVWPRRVAWVAIAAMVLFTVYLGRGRIDRLLSPRGPIATVASVEGSLFLVPDGVLKAGDSVSGQDTIRTGAGTHARLRLDDGSIVDMNQSTELSLEGAWSGDSIRLKRGDILVQAAKQHLGHLRVLTRDSLTSVKGTVFAVSSGLSGTLVSVVEGSVDVTHSGTDVLLGPGEQEATNPALESSVQQAISWSPDAESFIGMVTSLAQVEKRVAALPVPHLDAQSQVLPFMPRNMVVYGAVPNPSDNLDQVVSIMEQQAAENADFGRWWDSASGEKIKKIYALIQTITPNLGDEIVYGISVDDTHTRHIPVFLAEVKAGRQTQLEEAIQALGAGTNKPPLAYFIHDTLLMASDSKQDLDWIIANAGQGADSAFASEIADRYRQGLSWLLGLDIESIFSRTGNPPAVLPAQKVKHLFFDQRNVSGAAENEMTVSFNGPRTGLSSFVADTGSGGAAEYIPADTLAAGYIATREPQELFEELLAQLTRLQPSTPDNLARSESMLGIDISNDLARALGTESAFSLESFSVAGPVWTIILTVNDSSTLEASIGTLVERLNSMAENTGQTRRIAYSRETVDGRTWTSLRVDGVPFGVTWTYDRGYMVASSDRGTALKAIATRDGGTPLVWSADFQQQLPASAGIHPSGFLWLNTKGAFQALSFFVTQPELRQLLTERDPVLVALDAQADQIRVVSRSRMSRVVMDLLLYQGLGKTSGETQTTL